MTTNDILRRLRYALSLNDAESARIIGLTGQEIDEATLAAYRAKEGDEGYAPCPDYVLRAFLDGLIIERRGPRAPGAPPLPDSPLDNNLILKKLRIALSLQQDAMLGILARSGMKLSSSELSALFRKPGHKHYRACGDQLLRNFLTGLIDGPDQLAKSTQ